MTYMKEKPKVVVISNLIYPLRNPVFELLHRNKNYLFKFIFLRKTLGNRKWKIEPQKLNFNYQILPSVEIPICGKDYFPYIINPTIFYEMFKMRFDVIISIGWAYPTNLLLFLFCKIMRKPFILWSESTSNEKTWIRTMTKGLVKMMVGFSDGFLVSGTRAEEYLMQLGAKKNKIFILGNAIDNESFRKETLNFRQNDIPRKKLGLETEDFVLLYVGRFEKVKGLNFLLHAFKEAKEENSKLKLLLVGYGSLKKELQNKVNELNLQGVKFFGPIERKELARYYAISNVLVLPSYSETWGYVLNEALASSLPVIASSAVGGAVDMIKPGENGFIVKVGDIQDLKRAILEISMNKKLYSEMVEKCYPSISKFNYDNMAKQINLLLNKYYE